MAVSNAELGYGALLKRGDGGSPEVFTTVAEITSISPPSLDIPEVEVTHFESPNGFREYIPGLKDAGEFSFEINYVPNDATQNASTGIMANFLARTTLNWKIEFPQFSGTPTWAFPGYIKAFEPNVPVDDKITATITVRVTSAPTITP